MSSCTTSCAARTGRFRGTLRRHVLESGSFQTPGSTGTGGGGIDPGSYLRIGLFSALELGDGLGKTVLGVDPGFASYGLTLYDGYQFSTTLQRVPQRQLE